MKLVASRKKLVVIDDDPTGMQTVQDVGVFMDWSVATLRKGLASASPVFFVSVNSRSLNPDDARLLALEVGRNLRDAAELENRDILLASRSDSTLRGHFPYEVDSLISGFGLNPDGIVFTPAFLEAGRFTIDDVHWADQTGELVPVSETEFARDPMFSFKNSNLKAWVEEKTRGLVNAGDVVSISLKLLREGGPEAVAAELERVSNGDPVIVNAAVYDDLDVFSLALGEAENRGKRFVYRCSASFLKSRGGFEDRPLLTHDEMVSGEGPGLIVAGSYVEKTSRQLQNLLEARLAEGIELNVERLLDESASQQEIEAVSEQVNANLHNGITSALYTSRQVTVPSASDFAETGKSIMRGLCKIIESIDVCPAYFVAKGGITSIQVAKTALGVQEALALGQILPGVPVWRLGAGARWPGMTYVVFPGNVGDETALMRAVSTLEGE
jgi:uncharacterized protein YgbK (DUF1537 family)